MQYTIRDVPPEIDTVLRRLAREQSKSLNRVALEVLARGLDLAGQAPRRELDDIAGTWVEDPEFDRAIAEQRTVDADLWQ